MAYRKKPMPPELVMELRRMYVTKELGRLNAKVSPKWSEWALTGAQLEREKRAYAYLVKTLTERRDRLYDEVLPVMQQIGVLEKELRGLDARIRHAEKKARLALQQELGG